MLRAGVRFGWADRPERILAGMLAVTGKEGEPPVARVIHRRKAVQKRRPSLPLFAWVFGLVGVGWLAMKLWPLTAWGALDQPNWGADADLLTGALAEAARAALPFAVLLGAWRARVGANGSLVRGSVLTSIAALAHPALSVATNWAFEQSGGDGFETDSPLVVAITLLRIAITLASIGGAWSIADGLADAGARSPRWLGVVMAAVAVGLMGVAYLPSLLAPGVDLLGGWGLGLVQLTAAIAQVAAWFVVAGRLAWGLRLRLPPRGAWALGAMGIWVLVLLQAALAVSASFVQTAGVALGVAMSVGTAVTWVGLFAAFGLGLGRHRRRRPLHRIWLRK